MSLVLDLSDLQVVGASVNVGWMTEQNTWFQMQHGCKGHCVLLALRVVVVVRGGDGVLRAAVGTGQREGQRAHPESAKAACGL